MRLDRASFSAHELETAPQPASSLRQPASTPHQRAPARPTHSAATMANLRACGAVALLACMLLANSVEGEQCGLARPERATAGGPRHTLSARADLATAAAPTARQRMQGPRASGGLAPPAGAGPQCPCPVPPGTAVRLERSASYAPRPAGRQLKQIRITTPTPFQPFQGPTTTTIRPTPFTPGGPQVRL